MSRKIELLAPAGSFESLSAALDAGADAVYFGAGDLNMRSRSAMNFDPLQIKEVVRRCHERGAKAYLALNILIYDSDMEKMRSLCRLAKEASVDGCIAGDIAVITELSRLGVSVHMTVQANVCNIESVRFYSRFADVMVLARELSLEAIRRITRAIDEENICGPSGERVRIEVFAHGALCVAVSGKCWMSLSSYNRSANRGECFQNCRRSYIVRDAETGFELELDDHYVMSPKDICTIDFLDKLLSAGVSVLKIEGRGRASDYVLKTVSAYRETLDDYLCGRYDREKARLRKKLLSEVFNRGFWEGGYYLGRTLDMWSSTGGNLSTLTKHFIGKITAYYAHVGVGELKITTQSVLRKGDRILITGPTTGALEITLDEMRTTETVESAKQSDVVSFPVPRKIRINDKLYLLKERNGDEQEQ